MEELSVEEKAKRYDEILARATGANLPYYTEDIMTKVREFVEYLIPELKESEGEKIRKYLIKCVEENVFVKSFANNGFDKQTILAWLEKQGEHANFRNKIQIGDKVTRNRDGMLVNLSQLNRVAKKDENQEYQKPADKVEPKFKVGDWVVYNRDNYSREIIQVYDIRDGRYYFTDNVHFSWSIKECDEKSHLWTIQDAKDGDVLYLQKDGKEHIIIYKGVVKERFMTFVSAYCAYNGVVDAFCFADVSRYVDIAYGGIMPATKEQRDTLMKAMADDGYEWDAEKKELKKIEQKPAEWSEEDEKTIVKMRDFFIRVLGDRPDFTEDKRYEEFIEFIDNRLKSLKGRFTWKPSDLPHWKKSNLPNDNSTGFNSDYFCYKGYNINYKELFEKLPKDD